MPSKDTKVPKFNQYQKLDRVTSIICADLECIIENIDKCKNNPEDFFTTKVSKYILSGFSMPTASSFKGTENKHDVYEVKIAWKSFVNS